MNLSKRIRAEKWYEKQEEKNKQLEEEMVEKIKANKEFIQSLPPEKQMEYKLFKIVFSIFMIVFYLLAWFAYERGFIKTLVPALIIEGVITLVSFIIWKVKPKIIKYPSVFAMPLIAYGLTLLGVGGFFLSDALEGRFVKQEESIEIGSEQSIESKQETNEYELWLKENNLIKGDE